MSAEASNASGRFRWYALYVRSNCERTVQDSLEGKGYHAFSPSYRMRRKRADRTKDVILPLFPGYVFCKFDQSARLPILATPSVVRIVGGSKEPEPVDEKEILSIQTVVQFDRAIKPWPFLREGQQVQILAGALTGTVGRLLKVKNDYRLVLSITLLQRSVAVDVDRDSVIPIL